MDSFIISYRNRIYSCERTHIYQRVFCCNKPTWFKVFLISNGPKIAFKLSTMIGENFNSQYSGQKFLPHPWKSRVAYLPCFHISFGKIWRVNFQIRQNVLKKVEIAHSVKITPGAFHKRKKTNEKSNKHENVQTLKFWTFWGVLDVLLACSWPPLAALWPPYGKILDNRRQQKQYPWQFKAWMGFPTRVWGGVNPFSEGRGVVGFRTECF